MPEPYLGEIRMVAFPFAPMGWALCNGQFLSIAENQALFTFVGTTYGGDGRTTFALPNLQARVPVGFGSGTNLPMNVGLGQVMGDEPHVLTVKEMPAHTHQVSAGSGAAQSVSPEGTVWTDQTVGAYADHASGTMAPGAVSAVGGSVGHSNLQPYLVVNYIIALQGIYPSRD